MLDVGRLRALHAVAVHGSITAAAAALGFTPSAVSQQLAKLEREARAPLMDRAGKGVVLTPAGRLLAQTAREIFDVWEHAQVKLEAQRSAPAGLLRLAAFPTACRSVLPGLLGTLTAAHPDLDVRLTEVDPYRAVELVAAAEIDVAVVHDWHNTPLALPGGLTSAKLGDDHADVLLPERHPLAGREHLAFADLIDDRWISQAPGTMCHDWLARMFAEQGRLCQVTFQINEFQSQMAVVAAGGGVAVVPRLGRGPVPAGVRVVPVQPAPSRQVLAVWRHRADHRPAVLAALAGLHGQWDAQSESEI